LRPWNPSRLAIVGFLFTLSLFLLFGAGPNIIGHPLVLMLLGIVFVLALFGFLKRYEWTERRLYHKFAFAAGALGFFITLTPLQQLDKSRVDNTQGMLLVGIAATIMLLLLRKKLKSYLASVETEDRYCPDCGEEIPHQATFCPHCGTTL
jgi:peptidoglycan/LPS O-acetylase OafA/YrhL